MKSALQALIFDVDGTLADTERCHLAAFNHAFAEEGLGWRWDEALYTRLLEISGGKERILHYWRSTRADILDGLRVATAAGIATVITPIRFTEHHDFSAALRVLPSLAGVRVRQLDDWHQASAATGIPA